MARNSSISESAVGLAEGEAEFDEDVDGVGEAEVEVDGVGVIDVLSDGDAEGVESVEEQMAEIGQDERAALLAGRRSLAALVAARDALARAHGALLPA